LLATCKDGSPFSGTARSGAGRGHGGVKSWDTAAPSTTAPPTGAATAPATGAATPPAQTARGVPGAGQVWVNTPSKVYHCPGDRWYGKTKAGEYMLSLKPKAAASARIITRHAHRNRCKAEEPYCNCGPVNRLSITFVTGGIASAGQGRFSKCNFYFGRRQVQIVARSQPYTR
jgi:hypothetical protein